MDFYRTHINPIILVVNVQEYCTAQYSIDDMSVKLIFKSILVRYS